MDTVQMETIHSDTTEDLCHVASVLESEFEISPESLSLQDRQQVQHADKTPVYAIFDFCFCGTMSEYMLLCWKQHVKCRGDTCLFGRSQ